MFKYSGKFYSNFSDAFEALGEDFPVAGDEELFELSKDFIEAVDEDDYWYEGEDCPLDGDWDSGMASAGMGTDEYYGYFGGEDW